MLTRSRALTAIARRAYAQTSSGGIKPPAAAAAPVSAKPAGINDNVPGLSSKCVKPTTEPVGPGAAVNAAYKVPEYFCFDRFSYAEAEVEMAKFRCPQPTANRKE